MSQPYIEALLAELGRCRQTGNPRGRQVEAELRRLGHDVSTEMAVPDKPTETAVPKRRGRPAAKEA